jgi:hypothetical protein
MRGSKKVVKNQIPSGNNKLDQEQTQDLLECFNLLNFAYLFIEIASRKGPKFVDINELKPLLRPTYLSKWLCNVTMLFLCLINKTMAYFLIPKTLSIARHYLF